MESQIKIVDKLIEEGESFTFENFCFSKPDSRGRYGGSDTPEWSTFKIRAQNIVEKLLATNSPAMTLVAEGVLTRTEGYGSEKFDFAKSNLIEALKILKSTLADDVFGEIRQEASSAKSASLSNKIFVVHGHDQSLKTDVERFLHEVGLTPVVLHREADEGATIIEKFEKHSDVGFAFILLTPDEISYTADQINTADSEREIEYRARPNVIFEFGYFVAKLGRNRVCCLHKGDVVVPSDLSGLIYKKVGESLDTQAYAIIKELKSAGYKINL